MKQSSDFSIQEINRLVHLEKIPGYYMLAKERAYLDAYREDLRAEHEAEQKELAKLAKKTRRTRRKKQEETLEEPVETEEPETPESE